MSLVSHFYCTLLTCREDASSTSSRYWRQRAYLTPHFIAALLESPIHCGFLNIRSLCLYSRHPHELTALLATRLCHLFPSIASLVITSDIFIPNICDPAWLVRFPLLTEVDLRPELAAMFEHYFAHLAAARPLTAVRLDRIEWIAKATTYLRPTSVDSLTSLILSQEQHRIPSSLCDFPHLHLFTSLKTLSLCGEFTTDAVGLALRALHQLRVLHLRQDMPSMPSNCVSFPTDNERTWNLSHLTELDLQNFQVPALHWQFCVCC